MPKSLLGRLWRTLREGVFFLMGRRSVFGVDGRSMCPTLEPGDLVIVDPTRKGEVGSIVVAELMTGCKVVKRVGSKGDTTVSLTSDNPHEGVDSRQLGSFDVTQIVGEVTLTWPWRS